MNKKTPLFTCSATVHVTNWHTRRCGRPVKDFGLCGVHLNKRLKSEERDAAYTAERAQERTLTERASAFVSVNKGYVRMALDDFRHLLERVK